MNEDKDCSYGGIFKEVLMHKINKESNAALTTLVADYFKVNFQIDVDESKIQNYIIHVKVRWKKCGRARDNFFHKYEEWLKNDLMGLIIKRTNTSLETKVTKNFDDLSESQKRRRTGDLRDRLTASSSKEILFAAKGKLYMEKKNSAGRLLGEMNKSPGRAEKILHAYKRPCNITETFKEDEALALIIDLKLTRNSYNILRKSLTNKCTVQMLPSYNHEILKAKKRCYPDGIVITEFEAKINLQEILDHTAFRLLKTLLQDSSNISADYTIYYKWGFDGSSGHTSYKQGFEEKTSFEDGTILSTTVVPIKVIDNITEVVVWKNLAANSSSYCRPIRIAFEKENNLNTLKEHNRMKNDIAELSPIQIMLGDQITTVKHELVLTMLDQKAINVLEGNAATTVCYICDCKPSDMNNVQNAEKEVKIEKRHTLQYGISPLHAWINFYVFLLHLSYRLKLPDDKKRKFSRKTPEDDAVLNNTKQEIQQKFRERMGLIVDVPKPGFGNSNDGNTARRFFEDPDKTSDITGLDKNIISRFRNILIAINGSEDVHPDKFKSYAHETALLYVEKYDFYQMSPTVHKVLLHGGDLIENGILPLGLLGEECQEGSHKYFKIFRDNFSRKTSRRDTLTDIMYRFLVFSDPYIRSLRNHKATKKFAELPVDVKNMLRVEEESNDEENGSSDDLF